MPQADSISLRVFPLPVKISFPDQGTRRGGPSRRAEVTHGPLASPQRRGTGGRHPVTAAAETRFTSSAEGSTVASSSLRQTRRDWLALDIQQMRSWIRPATMTREKKYLTFGAVFVLAEESSPKGVSGREGRGPGVTPAPLPVRGLALSRVHARRQFPPSPWDRS